MEAAESAAIAEGEKPGTPWAALVLALDLHDGCTGRHSELVARLARRIGERLGVAGEELRLLELAARLHDVGKLDVADTILHKPGPLDEDEWREMRRHPDLGADILRKVPGLENVAPLVRSHHERWDGAGYPDGLARDEIPLASRVVSACDAFEAMTADRPYRRPLSLEEALAELVAGAESQFDPTVVAELREEVAAGSV